MNIRTQLQRAALYHSDRTAIIYGKKKMTYRQLNERLNRLGNGLLKLGLKKGDRVALVSQNRPQIIEGEYACYKTGLVQIPLNARLSIQELVRMFNHSEAKALIVGPEHMEDVRKHQSEIKTIEHYIAISDAPQGMIDYEKLLDESAPDEPTIDLDLEDLACFKYTSGSTGMPKAIMNSHRNRICLAKKILLIPDPEIDKDSVMCHVGPVTHGTGAIIFPIMIRGACNLILKGFDIGALLETIQKEKVTHLFAVPTMLIFMMEYPDIEKYDLSSIKTIVYGASPMPVSKIKKALDVFGPVFVQAYGQTETNAVTIFLSKEDHLFKGDPKKTKRLESIGRPHMECDIRVVNEDGKDVAIGEIGEIIERGDDTMVGYWKEPDLTAETIRNGWVYTGDMATVDEEGYIYLVNRKSDMIISGGFNIYPSEVENALDEHPAVRESVVMGVPDDKWVEAVKAVVVLKEGMSVSATELITHCEKTLAGYKKPKTVDFTDALPRDHYGKILRRKIAETYRH
jgi:acyl-CoA synthetase (AMP-forming)/AMP-acid ligase II